jgi:hypothetical protein
MDSSPKSTLNLSYAPAGSGWGANDERDHRTNTARSSPVDTARRASQVVIRFDELRRSLGLDKLPSELVTRLAAMSKTFGVQVVATADELSSVPIRDLPKRFEPIVGVAMPTFEALASADGFEFQLSKPASCHDQVSLQGVELEWPIDTSSTAMFAKKVGLLRRMSQGTLPIGLSMPIVIEPPRFELELGWLVTLDIDFVTLQTAASRLPSGHRGLNYFVNDPMAIVPPMKNLLGKAKRPIALGLDHLWNDGYEAAAACGLGVSYVCIDQYLVHHSPTARSNQHTFDAEKYRQFQTAKPMDELMDRSTYLSRLQHEWKFANDGERFLKEFQAAREFGK